VFITMVYPMIFNSVLLLAVVMLCSNSWSCGQTVFVFCRNARFNCNFKYLILKFWKKNELKTHKFEIGDKRMLVSCNRSCTTIFKSMHCVSEIAECYSQYKL